MILPLFILALFVPEIDAITAGRVSLGTLSLEVPKGWEVSAEEKRITGKPVATEETSSRKWYMPGSELFVILGPEPDTGRELAATCNQFFEDTFIGYVKIEMKPLNLKIHAGIEYTGFFGSLRNINSGDILYAVVMVLRHKGSHYYFVYTIDREDLFKEFSQCTFINIMDSIRTPDGSDTGSRK
jgi:hypothetical protein